MLTSIIEQIERTVLHMKPHRSVRFLNVSPSWAIEAMQRARFRRTLRLAAERSSFYREQFRKRKIDARRIELSNGTLVALLRHLVQRRVVVGRQP